LNPPVAVAADAGTDLSACNLIFAFLCLLTETGTTAGASVRPSTASRLSSWKALAPGDASATAPETINAEKRKCGRDMIPSVINHKLLLRLSQLNDNESAHGPSDGIRRGGRGVGEDQSAPAGIPLDRVTDRLSSKRHVSGLRCQPPKGM
jgi:hypothetical protein